MTSPIRFEAASPPVPCGNGLTEFTTMLRARPREWALLGQCVTGGAARQRAYEIRHGINRAFRQGGFEAQAATLFGEHRVYVRWTGGAR